jgi:hypothetical protein
MSVGFVPSILAVGQAAAAGRIPFWDDVSAFFGQDGSVHASAEGPLYSPDPWEQVWLNWKRLPGICKATGLPMLGIDKKHSNGQNGLVLNVNGYLPGPIEIESFIWTPEQWAAWQDVIPWIWSGPTSGKSKGSDLAVMISAPALDLLGIKQAVVMGMTPPERGPIPQSMVIKIKALEYVAPAPNLHKVKPAPKNVPLVQQYQRKNAPAAPSKGGNGLGGARASTLGGSD